jgi:hypothetical protein
VRWWRDLPPALGKVGVDFDHGECGRVDDRITTDAAAQLLRGEGLNSMRSKLLGLGLGLALSTLGVVAVPTVASADSTCYTGCTGPGAGTTPLTTPPVTAPVQHVSAPVEPPQAQAAGGLPFTGADIEGMAAAGAGALLVGGLMVRRSRRLRQAGI